MKKSIIYPLLITFAWLLLPSSNNDDEPVIAQYLNVAGKLPAYYVPKDQNALIDASQSNNDEIVLFNSTEEVKSQLENDFLQNYPSYLSVDFNKYSLIVKTAPVFPYTIDTSDSEYSIIFNPYRQSWQLTETIYVTDTLENDWYVQRIALITEKIPSGTAISHSYKIKTKYEGPVTDGKE